MLNPIKNIRPETLWEYTEQETIDDLRLKNMSIPSGTREVSRHAFSLSLLTKTNRYHNFIVQSSPIRDLRGKILFDILSRHKS